MTRALRYLSLVAVVVACSPRTLPAGYEAIYSDGDWYIVAPNKAIAVEPDVRTIAVVGKLIIGTAGGADDVGSELPDRLRFFVVDTGTGRTDYFESEEEWWSFLRLRGVESTPQLKSPAPLSCS
jgi:hypothetical protein